MSGAAATISDARLNTEVMATRIAIASDSSTIPSAAVSRMTMMPRTTGVTSAGNARRRSRTAPGPGAVATRMTPPAGRASSSPAEMSTRATAVGSATPMTGARIKR